MIRLYTFLIFVAIGTIGLYAIFIMPKADFYGQTTILVVPENTTSASNMNNTMNNMMFVAQVAVDKNKDVEKYDADVKIENLKDHDIMNVVVYGNSEADVKFIENSIFTSITKEINKYFSTEKDFTISVIAREGIYKTNSAMYAPYVLMIVLAIGVIAGVLALFHLWDERRDNSEQEESEIDAEQIFAHYNNDDAQEMTGEVEYSDVSENNEIVETINECEDNIEIEETKIIEEANSTEIVQDVQSEKIETKKDSFPTEASIPDGLPTTPGNLPVANLSDFGSSEAEEEDEELLDCEKEQSKEPTEEELKARLNELLNGKL